MAAERLGVVSAELVIWGTSPVDTGLLTAEGTSPIMLAGYRIELEDQGQRYRYYVRSGFGGSRAVPAQECRSRS